MKINNKLTFKIIFFILLTLFTIYKFEELYKNPIYFLIYIIFYIAFGFGLFHSHSGGSYSGSNSGSYGDSGGGYDGDGGCGE